MRATFLAILVVAIVGCSPQPPEPDGQPKPNEGVSSTTPESQTPGVPNTTASGGTGGGNESIGIVSPAAGGMSPVTNPQAVEGAGGGGTYNAAKDQARRVGGGGGSSLNQMPAEGE